MPASRPKNLNLFTIQFPVPAIVSILHRLTGLLLFLAIPFLLWTLSNSLTSEGFEAIQESADSLMIKGILWLVLSAFFYHVVAGIKHLLGDIHLGDQLKCGRIAAYLTLGISVFLSIMIGIWLW